MEQSNLNTQAAKILVVDDTINSLRLMANMLTDQGYNVRKVLNGQMALTAAQSAPPDLILLDINMPQLNGYEVCQQLKSNPLTADVPVIFISALDEVLDKVKAFSVGGVDYITKPFYFEELITRVETQLKIRFLQKEILRKTELQNQVTSQYVRLLNFMQEGFFRVSLEGNFQKINLALAQISGYESPDSFLNGVNYSIYNFYSQPNHWNEIILLLDSQPEITLLNTEIYTKDKKSLNVSEKVWIVNEYDTKVVYYEGILFLGKRQEV